MPRLLRRPRQLASRLLKKKLVSRSKKRRLRQFVLRLLRTRKLLEWLQNRSLRARLGIKRQAFDTRSCLLVSFARVQL